MMNNTCFPMLSWITSDLFIIFFFSCHTIANPLRPVSNLLKSSWFQSHPMCPASLGPKKNPHTLEVGHTRQGSHCSSVGWGWHELGLPRCLAGSGRGSAKFAVSVLAFPHHTLSCHCMQGNRIYQKAYLKSSLTELSSGIFAEHTELLAWDVQKHSVGLGAQILLLLNTIALLPAARLVLQQLSSYYILPLASLAL